LCWTALSEESTCYAVFDAVRPYKYLPPYSPELNLIEILWRRIKYTWLPFSAYECLNALSEALETILSHVGSEYQITFA
jgi:transposase